MKIIRRQIPRTKGQQKGRCSLKTHLTGTTAHTEADHSPLKLVTSKKWHKSRTKKVTTAAFLMELNKVVEAGIASIPRKRFPRVTITDGVGDEEIAVLVISDLQIGHKTPTTNMKIIAKRAELMAERALKIIEIQRRAHPIKELKIFLLGDCIQSEDIGFKVSLNELDATLMEQIFNGAVPILETLLLRLAPYFPRGIDVHTVSGNHGRLDRFHSETTNWDTIIYKLLEARLLQYPEIRWHIEGEKFYQVVCILKWSFLLVHGDQIPMYMNIPWYGITMRAMRWSGSIRQHFKYMVLGHFHVASETEWNDKEIFVNGCFVTDDQWVLKGLGLQSTAKQWAFGVHPRKGVTWRYKIMLEHANRPS